MNSCHERNARSDYAARDCNDDGGFGRASSRLGVTEARREPPHHRRLTGCCILAGDTEGGGLDMEMPVAGLMMGMALRARVAEGW
jgi:hypothetical protein